MSGCDGNSPQSRWEWISVGDKKDRKGLLKNPFEEKCLSPNDDKVSANLITAHCDENDANLIWQFDFDPDHKEL
jgi:hypothetical protein